MDTPSPRGSKLVRTPISEKSYFPSGSLSSSFVSNPDESRDLDRPQRLFWGTMEPRPEYGYRWPSENSGKVLGKDLQDDGDLGEDNLGDNVSGDSEDREDSSSEGREGHDSRQDDKDRSDSGSVLEKDSNKSENGLGFGTDHGDLSVIRHSAGVLQPSDEALTSQTSQVASQTDENPATNQKVLDNQDNSNEFNGSKSFTSSVPPRSQTNTPIILNPAIDDFSPTPSRSSSPSRIPNQYPSRTPSKFTHDSFQNSSFFEDTRAQFDLDINIDDYHPRPRKQSPWRDFRSRGTNFLTTRNISEASAAASSARIDDLTKQLTNCKIQLRLYEKFLQDLIDRRVIPGDYGGLGGDFGLVNGLDNGIQEEKSEVERDKDSVLDRSKSFDQPTSKDSADSETSALMEDLYNSLEEYQQRWQAADKDNASLRQTMASFASEVAQLLESVGVSAGTNSDPSAFLASALPLLRENTKKATETRTESSASRPEPQGSRSEPHVLHSEAQARPEFQVRSDSQARHFPDSLLERKLSDNQQVVEALQREVRELQLSQTRSSSQSLLQTTFSDDGYFRSHDRIVPDRLTQLQKDYELLQNSYAQLEAEHTALVADHEKYRTDTEKSLAALTARLNRQTRDDATSRATAAQISSLQHELDAAVDKQRVLTTEKIKLAYQVEAMAQDKHALEKTVESLNAKVARSDSAQQSSTGALERALDDAVRQFDKVFEVDVRSYERLLKSFDKIADEGSLQKPRRNVQHLSTLKNVRLLEQSPDAVFSAREAHRSVADYFGRAVDVVVNDHIKLLLRESDTKTQNEQLVAGLRQKIQELQLQVRQRPDVRDSPRSKLRIEELTNRWKAEREARISDNRQAKKRLMEMEQENR